MQKVKRHAAFSVCLIITCSPTALDSVLELFTKFFTMKNFGTMFKAVLLGTLGMWFCSKKVVQKYTS